MKNRPNIWFIPDWNIKIEKSAEDIRHEEWLAAKIQRDRASDENRIVGAMLRAADPIKFMEMLEAGK